MNYFTQLIFADWIIIFTFVVHFISEEVGKPA